MIRNGVQGKRWAMSLVVRSQVRRERLTVPLRFAMDVVFRLMLVPALLASVAACSRSAHDTSSKAGETGEVVSQSDDDTMGLMPNALNYTDVPIGRFYVDGVWGGNVRARVGSGGIGILCCVSLPGKWHPGLTVTVEWRNDEMYARDPKSMASRVVPVEKSESFSDGFLWVLFLPGDRIKVYASRWMPGFPEGLQAPNEACPGHFTLRNDDPRCPHPDKRIKS